MVKRNVLNRLLLLQLINKANGVNGATRIQKLVFDIESNGRDKGSTTFNYKFIRWHYGPYSSEIKDDLDFLVEKGLLSNNDNNNHYTITATGKELLKSSRARELISLEVNKLLDNTIKTYNEMSLEELLTKIYKAYNIDLAYNKGDIIHPILNEEIGEYV